MDEKLVTTEQSGPIGILRLNAPAKLNAMTPAMGQQLAEAVDAAIHTSRVLIITAVGRGFCAGAALEGYSEPRHIRDAGAPLEQVVNPLLLKLRNLPIPWITAVRGPAAGVGASLALAADMVVASETAIFLEAFARVGLIPDGGASYLLTRTIGRVRAMEMALLAEPLKASQALAWGLINRVVPDDQLEAESLALAARLAKGARLSLHLTRTQLWAAMEEGFAQTLDRERHNQCLAGRDADFDEGIAAFLQKRPPQFGAEQGE